MKRLLVVLLAVIALPFSITAASAANITFDEHPLGTFIDDEYQALGVLFFEGFLTPRLPQTSMNGAMPNQPVLRPTGEPDFGIFQGDFWMYFPNGAWDVVFDSGYWDVPGSAVIDVYSSDGFFTLTNPGTGVQSIDLSSYGLIYQVYFNSISDPAGGDIDDLSFESAPNFIDAENEMCIAQSTGDTPGNTVVTVFDPRIQTVVTRKGRVNAVCHGADNSGIYEEIAEQGSIPMPDCYIRLADGTLVTGGWGHFVAAANDNDCGYPCGGNVTIVCHGFLPD
jgi:hypothetical protein